MGARAINRHVSLRNRLDSRNKKIDEERPAHLSPAHLIVRKTTLVFYEGHTRRLITTNETVNIVHQKRANFPVNECVRLCVYVFIMFRPFIIVELFYESLQTRGLRIRSFSLRSASL